MGDGPGRGMGEEIPGCLWHTQTGDMGQAVEHSGETEAHRMMEEVEPHHRGSSLHEVGATWQLRESFLPHWSPPNVTS